jgi:xylan 1,4-beta-xylosidase
VAVAIWNGTLDPSKGSGDRALDRRISLTVEGLTDAHTYELRHHRVDAQRSNIAATWERLGCPDWPDDTGWRALRGADRLELLEPVHGVIAVRDRLELAFDLPMPAVSLVELVPTG